MHRQRDLPTSLDLLRGFEAAARRLSFTLAAQELFVTQSAVSRQVKALAMAHVADLERKAQELLAMKSTLEHLVHCCHGDDRPDCPIIETLESAASSSSEHAHHNGLRPGRRRARAA